MSIFSKPVLWWLINFQRIIASNHESFSSVREKCKSKSNRTRYVERCITIFSRSQCVKWIRFTYLHVPSSLQYKTHQIPTLKIFSYCLAAVFAESLEGRCSVENEDVVGAAPTDDAPTTSEWSTILLPTNVRLILDGLRLFLESKVQLRTKCLLPWIPDSIC